MLGETTAIPYPTLDSITVIGGGLAGSEAAWQAARLGVEVRLIEMRPGVTTPAHTSGALAELVCSNSLGSDALNRAPGLLKAELRRLGSLILEIADAHRVPAGSALAVDREGFAAAVTARLEGHPRITVVREEATAIPEAGVVILASGPLTSPALAEALRAWTGTEALSFYDALAPIVDSDTINFEIAFRASRYDRGEQEEGDYINCPMTQEEYTRFVEALLGAERIPLRDFERDDPHFFEACLPVEVLAQRGPAALAFGPLRPVGLRDPRTGKRPYAVVQLRQDNAAGNLYNLVGFQTNLRYGEQERVFRLIPGLEKARFVRHGAMHRNTYIHAPRLLTPTLQFKNRPTLLCAGQLAGLEGYVGNVMGGWLAGINAARVQQGAAPGAAPDAAPVILPITTMSGALIAYITQADAETFQPMKANFGLLPPLEASRRGKRARGEAHAHRALVDLENWLATLPWLPASPRLTDVLPAPPE